MEVGVFRQLFFKRFGDLSFSRPVIPVQDSSTPQIHSAINSMKNLFLTKPPPDEGSVFSLNCVRVGDTLADYSDLHHLSVNELLTTWDSGKRIRETISKVLKFLVVDCYLDADLIYVAHGSDISYLDPDCFEILLQYLPKENIFSWNSKGSYWNIDDDGPCGPCLQIYYDDALSKCERRTAIELIMLNDHKIPRIVTIAFVQFNREEDGRLIDLPFKHLITGMDFESLLIVLQGELNFYDTDVAVPLLDLIQEVANYEYKSHIDNEIAGYPDQLGMAFRFVTNHLRIMILATTDVTQLGNCGREYLLKSIDRQAIQLGIETLGIPQDCYANLVIKSIKAMVQLFPELMSSLGRINQIVESEAQIYHITLAEIAYDEAQQPPPIRTKKITGKVGKQLDDLEPSTKWYKTREIKFWDHRTHIVLTDKTNKCCLAALCNALLLGGKISLGENVKYISEGQLLYRIQNCLLCGNGNMELQSSLERSNFQKQVLNTLTELSTISSLAVELHSINGFVSSPLTSLFEYLRVPLYHGCLMDTEDKELAPGGPQLTLQGLTFLRAGLREKEPCVLFWNGSFITATNLNGCVYLLLDDIRFIDKYTHVCWELLEELYRGGQFRDCSFTHVDLDASYTILPLTKSEKKKWKKTKQVTKDRTAEHAEAQEELHQIDISQPSISKCLYKTSQINFMGRQLNIVLQEWNGPCSLIAICNVLLLKGEITLEQTEVDEDYLLNILKEHLQQSKGGLPYSEMPSEAHNVMRKLSSHLEVDVTFDRIDGFNELPLNILIRFLGISLYHTWLPDPDDDTLLTLSSYSYSTLQIAAAESAVPNVEQVRNFLEGSQLTDYGLCCLRNALKENIPCIIFWHNHYSAVVKIKSEVYALATAANYIGTHVVWEKLGDKGATEPMDSNFCSAVAGPCLQSLDLPGSMPDYTSLHEQSGQMASHFSSETISRFKERSERISSSTVRCRPFRVTNDPNSATDSETYIMSLREFAESEGNNFSEIRELPTSGVPLLVVDTTFIGRIIGTRLLQQIVDAHQAGRSFDGQFDEIYVRSGWHTKLTVSFDATPNVVSPENGSDYTSYVKDWQAYVDEVISLYEIKGVGYPAFFLPLIKSLLEEPQLNVSTTDHERFWFKIETNLAFKFSLIRGEFWNGIHRIRRNVPHSRAGLRRLLSEVVLIDGKDWRQVISESEHPLLKKLLRYTEEDDVKIGKNESVNEKEFGNFLPSLDSASIYPRQVNEHAGAKSKDGDEEMDISFGSFAELELLYSHYLQVPLAKAHELIVTCVNEMELFDWLYEVIEMLERVETKR